MRRGRNRDGSTSDFFQRLAPSRESKAKAGNFFFSFAGRWPLSFCLKFRRENRRLIFVTRFY